MHPFFAGTYIDKKCPFTGDVSIRGRIITGTCHSAKMIRTIIVRRDYLHFVKKYQRQEHNFYMLWFLIFKICFFICSVTIDYWWYHVYVYIVIGFLTLSSILNFLYVKVCEFSHLFLWYCFSDMRRGTRTFQHMFPHASVWKKEIMLLLANAGFYYHPKDPNPTFSPDPILFLI